MARDYWAYYTPSDIGMWADRDLGEERFVQRVYEMAQAARPRVQMKELYQEYRSLLAGKRASDDEEEYTMLSEEVQEVQDELLSECLYALGCDTVPGLEWSITSDGLVLERAYYTPY